MVGVDDDADGVLHPAIYFAIVLGTLDCLFGQSMLDSHCIWY